MNDAGRRRWRLKVKRRWCWLERKGFEDGFWRLGWRKQWRWKRLGFFEGLWESSVKECWERIFLIFLRGSFCIEGVSDFMGDGGEDLCERNKRVFFVFLWVWGSCTERERRASGAGKEIVGFEWKKEIVVERDVRIREIFFCFLCGGNPMQQ